MRKKIDGKILTYSIRRRMYELARQERYTKMEKILEKNVHRHAIGRERKKIIQANIIAYSAHNTHSETGRFSRYKVIDLLQFFIDIFIRRYFTTFASCH